MYLIPILTFVFTALVCLAVPVERKDKIRAIAFMAAGVAIVEVLFITYLVVFG